MEENIEEIKKKRDEYLAGWQRARADFLNYKKEEKERAVWRNWRYFNFVPSFLCKCSFARKWHSLFLD